MIKKRTLLDKLWETRYMWLMLLPGVAYIIIFAYIPMGGVFTAFKNIDNRLGVFGSPWVGFSNFRFLFISGRLWTLTRNTLAYNTVFISVGLFMEVCLAITINELPFKKTKKIMQSITFLPFFMSWVVVSSIVMAIFGWEFGFLNNVLTSMGFRGFDLWGNPPTFPIFMVAIRTWKVLGYGTIIYLASIASMDQELLEVAEIDGANIWQRSWHITMAHIRPTMAIMMLLGIGQIFRSDIVMYYLLVGRAQPLIQVTDVIDTYVFRTMVSSANMGMAAAAGLYQSILCFVIVVAANFAIKKIDPDYSLF